MVPGEAHLICRYQVRPMLQLHPAPIGKGKIGEYTPPSSNTGGLGNQIEYRTDWARLAFRQEIMPRDLQSFGVKLFVHLAKRGILRQQGWKLDDQGKGFNGFERGVNLYFNGDMRGSLQWGGKSQRGWVLLEVRGGLCSLFTRREHLALYRTACKYNARINRVDICLDDKSGSLFDVGKIREDFHTDPSLFLPVHRQGKGSRPPVYEWYESSTGRTLYIGSRESTSRGVVYEKGLQLQGTIEGNNNPDWVRWETRFTRNKYVELEPELLHPDYWLQAAVGSSAYLANLLNEKGCRFTMKVQKEHQEPREIAANALLTLNRQWGGVIGHLRRVFGSDGLLDIIERNDQDSPLLDINRRDSELILELLQALRLAGGNGGPSAASPAPAADEDYQEIF